MLLVGVGRWRRTRPRMPGKAQHGLELQQRKILGLGPPAGGRRARAKPGRDRGQQEFQQVREIGLGCAGLGPRAPAPRRRKPAPRPALPGAKGSPAPGPWLRKSSSRRALGSSWPPAWARASRTCAAPRLRESSTGGWLRRAAHRSRARGGGVGQGQARLRPKRAARRSCSSSAARRVKVIDGDGLRRDACFQQALHAGNEGVGLARARSRQTSAGPEPPPAPRRQRPPGRGSARPGGPGPQAQVRGGVAFALGLGLRPGSP